VSINPKIGFWLNAVAIVLNALIGISWATYFDAKTAGEILFGLGSLLAVINGALHGFSGPQKGPLLKAWEGS
jgi:hypothetical protein